jgi:hypothetical protein
MSPLYKAYLPKWQRWLILPMLGLAWLAATYAAFFTEEGRGELGIVGWLLITAVMALAGTLLWLMTSGRLPAYFIEIPDDPTPGQRRER